MFRAVKDIAASIFMLFIYIIGPAVFVTLCVVAVWVVPVVIIIGLIIVLSRPGNVRKE